MNELIVRWKNGETAIYRFTTKGDAVTAKMIFENHCGNGIRDIKINALDQQLCEDCVSREQALDIINHILNFNGFNSDELLCLAYYRINELPPVTPSYNSIKTELKSCEDCISRQAAIDEITKIHPIDTEYDCTLYDKLDVMYVLKDLPPVIPQRPKGKWIEIEIDAGEFIYKCTKCGMRVINPYKYCPNCGAEMEGGGEE